MAFKSGKHGRFKVGSTNVPCRQWDMNYEAVDIDSTNSESANAAGVVFDECILGTVRGDITAQLVYDSAAAYLNAILPGGNYTVNLLPDLNDASVLFAGTVFVKNARVVSRVRELTVIEVTGRTNGVFTVVGL